MKISEECTAIVFYGVDLTTKAVACFYDTAVGWFKGVGHPPDKAAIRGPGHSGKFVSFERADSKIRKNGIDGVTHLDLFALMENARILANDYCVTAGCSEKYSFMYLVARSSIGPLSRSAMLPLAKQMAACGSPEYGIGYTRDHRLGPSTYAIGISQGLGEGVYHEGTPQREEGLRISFWMRAMNDSLWRQGVLRDVYPWNFLNTTQLDMSVDGISLGQWIQKDSHRGKLEVLNDGLFLWEIANVDLPSVRQVLQGAEIIFDWRKYYGLGHPER
jgi:hypothetical protein